MWWWAAVTGQVDLAAATAVVTAIGAVMAGAAVWYGHSRQGEMSRLDLAWKMTEAEMDGLRERNTALEQRDDERSKVLKSLRRDHQQLMREHRQLMREHDECRTTSRRLERELERLKSKLPPDGD